MTETFILLIIEIFNDHVYSERRASGANCKRCRSGDAPYDSQKCHTISFKVEKLILH